MKNPTDALGNEIFQGALVGVKIGDQFFVGNVTFLSTGGIQLATGGSPKPQQTPGQLVVSVQIPVMFAPESRIGAIYRMIDPNAQMAVEEAAKTVSKDADRPFVIPSAGE